MQRTPAQPTQERTPPARRPLPLTKEALRRLTAAELRLAAGGLQRKAGKGQEDYL